jgi:hypothetical protein
LPQPRHPTAALAQALARDGLPPGIDPATLIVLEQRGAYSGRRVSYFRVINPDRTAERVIQVRVFGDLDDHPELIVGSGHVEQDGAVVLTRRDRGHSPAAPDRSEADRADHGDDEQFVFPGVAS